MANIDRRTFCTNFALVTLAACTRSQGVAIPMNARTLLLLICATALAACGASTSLRDVDATIARDTTGDVPSIDAAVDVATLDRPTTMECVTAADCTSMGARPSTRWCASSWSCIAGYCTWECNGGRTCTLAPGGCIECPMPWGRQCPGARCAVELPAQSRIEEVFCMRPFHTDIRQCFGEWARLSEGRFCSVNYLPTGALRALVACAGCQTVLMW